MLRNILSRLNVPEENRHLREQIIHCVFEILSREKPDDTDRWVEQIEKLAKWNEVV
jgi:hypothetical protein